jgi:hypothetical protein
MKPTVGRADLVGADEQRPQCRRDETVSSVADLLAEGQSSTAGWKDHRPQRMEVGESPRRERLPP